jgi:hypothetical protein
LTGRWFAAPLRHPGLIRAAASSVGSLSRLRRLAEQRIGCVASAKPADRIIDPHM